MVQPKIPTVRILFGQEDDRLEILKTILNGLGIKCVSTSGARENHDVVIIFPDPNLGTSKLIAMINFNKEIIQEDDPEKLALAIMASFSGSVQQE